MPQTDSRGSQALRGGGGGAPEYSPAFKPAGGAAPGYLPMDQQNGRIGTKVHGGGKRGFFCNRSFFSGGIEMPCR